MKKRAEAGSFSRIAYAVLGKRVVVKFLEEGNPNLGYTNGEKGEIYLAWEHPIFSDLKEDEKKAFRMGVFTHELLHQVYTNFTYTEELLASLKDKYEQMVFMKFANTLEDPAIEYFAGQKFGGVMLNSLKFSIRQVYKKTPSIEESPTAFTQFINALTNFGDMGFIKGEFTFPEAQKYFKIVAPLYNKGITCPDNRKRLDIAKECMELTRALWEKEINERREKDEEFSKLIEELKKDIEEFLKKKGSLSDESMAEEEEGTESEGSSARRKIVISKMAEEDEDSETGDESSETEEEDYETEESSETEGSSETGEEDSETGEEDSETEEEDSETVEEDSETEDDSEIEGKSNPEDEYSLPDELFSEPEDIEKEYEITEEAIKKIEEAIKREVKNISESETGDSEILDIDITTNVGASSINNIDMRQTFIGSEKAVQNLYNEYKSMLKVASNRLYKELKKIFDSDNEEYARNINGKYNVLRGSVATSTRMFDKKKDKNNYSDVEIVLLCDHSGSMRLDDRIESMKRATITISEALTMLDVKHYIVGFTADNGYDATHLHYVKWNNNKIDRSSLVLMEADGNNFDGCSIRYASHLFDKRQCENKILMILSDGEPACRSYKRKNIGISDTASAIREARKRCRVFGIAFGNGCDSSVLQSMYGSDFIYCRDEKLLANVLAKKLKKLVMKK